MAQVMSVSVILMILHPARSTLFPYTTLFRSQVGGADEVPRELDAPRDRHAGAHPGQRRHLPPQHLLQPRGGPLDRKSTRLNSSHVEISYAVFCLKKKIMKLAASLCCLFF